MPDLLPLAPWERALAIEQIGSNGFNAGWLVELDRSLDLPLVLEALRWTRVALPVYFSRVRKGDVVDYAGLALEPERPIECFVKHVSSFAGGGKAYLRVLANDPLNPVQDGLFRCHVIDGSPPCLGFQCGHAAGDGFSNWRLRQVFAAAVDALERGDEPRLERGSLWPGLSIDEMQRLFPIDPRGLEDLLRRKGSPQVPGLALPLTPKRPELRVFNAVIGRATYARVVADAARLKVGPLAILASAFALAARQEADPWPKYPQNFLALAVPRDLRVSLGMAKVIGNLSLPQGLPVFADDPRDRDTMAQVLSDRMRRGRNNRVLYRHFLNALREQLAGGGAIRSRVDETWHPFASFGVTEIPNWGEVASIGQAHVVRAWYQTPLLTRRFVAQQVHLSCTVAWHETLDGQLRSIFGRTLSSLIGDEPTDWDLL